MSPLTVYLFEYFVLQRQSPTVSSIETKLAWKSAWRLFKKVGNDVFSLWMISGSIQKFAELRLLFALTWRVCNEELRSLSTSQTVSFIQDEESRADGFAYPACYRSSTLSAVSF